MEDNIGTGSDNKIPLIIGIGAIALAVLALAFAIKAKGDAKGYEARFKAIEEAGYATKSDVNAVASNSAKAAEVQDISAKITGLEGYVNTQVVPAIQAQKTVLDGLVKRPVTATSGHTATGGATAPVAGPGEYVVKSGDNFSKIARSSGVSVSALEAVNPGVSSKNLKVGQKLKLPEKK